MPNWCITEFTITASNASLKVLNEKFEEAFKVDTIENDFGSEWIGNLLVVAGEDEDYILHGSYNCRGWISYYEYREGNNICLSTESAWSPSTDCIRLFCSKFVDDADITYVATEPGNLIFLTNDSDVEGKCDIYTYINRSDTRLTDEDYDILESFDKYDYLSLDEDEVKDILKDISVFKGKADRMTVDEMTDYINRNTDNSVCVNVYEYEELL